MLQMDLIDFFTIAIPEGFIYIFAIYVLGNCKVEKKRYLIASGLQAIIAYIVRLLPISYGIHTIILIGVVIAIGVRINKLNSIVVIRATIITVILQMISEGIVMATTQVITDSKIAQVLENKTTKIICSASSLFILLSIILMIRIVKRRQAKSF